MKFVFFGLSLSSSWGNGHATTYRGLVRALERHGHVIVFYEKDVPWYADNRDLADPDFCRLKLYRQFADIDLEDIKSADAVIIGSFVKESKELVSLCRQNSGAAVAYYDIDTPVTVAKLAAGDCEYLSRETIPEFDIYFSFTGGPLLDRLQNEYGACQTQLLGCSADPDIYRTIPMPRKYALGYLGTYDESRQPMLERLMFEPARQLPDRRFIVAGPQYPSTLDWPANVEWIDHLPPDRHAEFYNSLQFALNVTRADMVEAGYSPSVRLFEAASCGRPAITDPWKGLEEFFVPGTEVLVASSSDDIMEFLSMPEEARESVGRSGRSRVLQDHTADARAMTLERAIAQAIADKH